MGLTQIKAEGIATGAVTTTKLEDDAVSNAKLTSSTNQANRAVGADTVQDDAIGIAALSATGTASSSTYLRGDNTWSTVSAGTALTGSTDNTICTVTGANAIQGEANLTFDGTDLSVTGKILVGTTALGANADDLCLSTAGNTGLSIKSGTTSAGNIYFADGTSGTDLYRGYVSYDHNTDRLVAGTANTTALTIDSSGNIEADIGNIVIGTSGKGIDFSAHGNAGGSTSELLDDYETGTWTIDGDTPNFNGFGSVDCHYSKVGRLVTISGTMVCNTNTSSTSFYVKYIPFAPDTKINIPVASAVSAADDGLFFFIDAGATTGYLRNASYGIQTYGTFSNKTLYFTCSYVSNA